MFVELISVMAEVVNYGEIFLEAFQVIEGLVTSPIVLFASKAGTCKYLRRFSGNDLSNEGRIHFNNCDPPMPPRTPPNSQIMKATPKVTQK